MGSQGVRRIRRGRTGAQDATERKQAESEKLRVILDSSPDAIVVTDLSGNITECNRAALDVTGVSAKEELLGKNAFDLISPKDRQRAAENMEKTLKQGSTRNVEYTLLTRDGREYPAELSASLIRDSSGNPSAFVAIIKDITERKMREEQLLESERRFRAMFDSVGDAILLINIDDFTIAMANKAALEEVKMEEREVIGKTCYGYTHNRSSPCEPPNDICPIEAMLKTAKSITVEHTHYDKDGKPFYVEVSASPVKDAEGRIVRAVHIARNITERKRREDELRIVNRTLGVLRACNQALIRAEEETDLLNDICRIIVRVGGYHMAWVGFAEQDKEKTIRPVAKWGYDAGYLNSVRFTWADTELGRGPTGKVIRTGKPRVINNISTEPDYPPRVEATKRGYASQLTLPFIAHERAFGVLNIYAAEPNAFNEEEVNLLTELANDLSYGITALRMRAERKRAEEQIKKIQEYLQLQVNRMPIGLIVWDAEFRVKTWNPSAARIFGFSENEALGKHPYDFIVPKEAQPHVDEIWGRLLAGDKTAHSVNENLTKDGRTIICAWTNTPLKRDDDTVIGVLSMVQDVTQRKQMEDALKTSEEKYSTLVEKGNDGIIIIQDGKLAFVNQKIIEIAGFSLEEAIGKPFTEFVSPEYRESVLETYKRRLKGEAVPSRYEIEIIAKSGNKIPVEINVSIIEYEGRTADMAIIRDITERKRLEEAKLRAEAEAAETRTAKETIEGMMDAVVLTDLEGRIVQFNRAFMEMLGYGEEALGRLPTNFVVEREIPRVAEAVKEAFEKGYLKNYESTVITKDGREFPVLVSATLRKDQNGNPAGLITTIKDITERKRMEAALRESEERFRGIAERSFDAILMMNLEGRLTYVSPAAVKITGYTPEEATGKPVQTFLPESEIPKMLQAFTKVVGGGYVEGLQLAVLRRDGSSIFIEVNGSPIVEDGEVVGIQVIFRDIMERKKIEEERLRLEDVKSRFVSASAHELKTPLAAIKGYADLLTCGILGETSQPVKDGLTVILRNTNRMLQLIGELLDVQRMENGMVKLNKEAVDLAGVVKESIEDMTPIINRKKLQLELLLPEAGLTLLGDKMRLHEVVENLLSNAIKFTPENGRIKVTATEDADQRRVSVSDTGIGISAEYLPHVFDPFAKIPKARFTGDYGTFSVYETGLGLSVTKHIVEMHGGKIWAESPGEEKGSTFTFTLPKEVKKT